jgi:carbonic anhydrase
MAAMDELLARRRAVAATRVLPEPSSSRPRLRTVVVLCMDARIDPADVLQLQPGDAHVLRNAGGLVTDDVLRSLVLSQRMLGTSEVAVIQHTRCGLSGLHDADLLGRVTAEAGVAPPFAFGGFDDVEQSVRRSIDKVRTCPWLLSRDMVQGYVYDVDTGDLTPVEA